MDAFSIKDKQGNPIFDDGYLTFICEESDNIIRVDPNQFNFSGSEPYPMEHDGIKYKLYLIKNPNEAGNAVHPDELESDNLKKDGSGTEKGSLVETDGKKQVWNKKNTEVLMGLYQEMGGNNCFTYYPESKIWEKISEELQCQGFQFSSVQVENRVKIIERELKMKLKRAHTLQLVKIKHEPGIINPLNNRELENVFEANENVDKKSNAFEEPESDSKSKYSQEDNNYEGKPPPINIENHMEVEEDSKSEPESPSSLNTKLTDFRVLCQNTRNIEWNEENTKLLTDLYKKYSPELVKVGKFASKTQMWSKISDDLKSQGYCFDPIQVQTRWRNLSAKYNRTEDSKKNSKSPEYCKENEENMNESHDLAFKELKDPPLRKRDTRYSDPHNIEDSKVNVNKYSRKASWTEEQAELLIDEYKEITQNNNLLKFGSKKYLWKKVAQDLRNRGHNFTPQQVHSKWKSLQRSLKTKLDKLKKSKLHQAHINTSNRSNFDHKYCDVKQQKTFKQPEAKRFELPLEVILESSSEEESKSLPQGCSVIVPDDVKVISESLNKLSSIKERYYKDRLLLKEKKLKAFEERTVEIRKTNDLLKQFLKK